MSTLFWPLLVWILNNWTTDNSVQNTALNRYEFLFMYFRMQQFALEHL